MILFILCFGFLVSHSTSLTPLTRNNLILEPSLTYISLDSSLSNFSAQIAFYNSSLYILGRKDQGDTYYWLQRDNVDTKKTVYNVVLFIYLFQTRNYNSKSILLANGFSYKGFIPVKGELGYIIAVEDSTNNLYILTTQLVSTTAYLITQQKIIPKTSKLNPEIYIKWKVFQDSAGNTGFRIVIGGTTQPTSTNPEHIFFALFNTVYNITEYLYEEASSVREICRNIEIDDNNNQILIISDIYSDSPIDITCNSPVKSTISWNVAVRALSFDRQAIEWTQIIGHMDCEDHFAGSIIWGNYLLITLNTNRSHQAIPLSTVTDVEFAIIRAETGEVTSSACSMVLSGDRGSIKSIDIVSAGEAGIYLLADVEQGNVKYVQNSLTYTFSENSYAILLFNLNTSTALINPSLDLLDIEGIPKSTSQIAYPLARILTYYPMGYIGFGAPELLLAAHIDANTNKGIIFYGFSNVICSATVSLYASYNPFITSSCSIATCARCFAAAPNLCTTCITSPINYLAKQLTCTPLKCPSKYYTFEGTICKPCHSSCLTCSGPLRYQCLTCDSTRTYNPLSQECICPSPAYVVNGQCLSNCLAGQSAVTKNGICKDKCPRHTFYYADYASTSPVVKSPATSASEGSDLLQFNPGSPSYLKLPGPTGINAIPSSFTVSFWIKMNVITTETLLWGFNSFKITSSSSGSIQFYLSQSISPFSFGASSSTGLLVSNTWTFIAGSVKSNSASYNMFLYIVRLNQVKQSAAGQNSGTSALNYPLYSNWLLVGCDGNVDSNGVLTPLPGITFGGNVRELVFMRKYHGIESLDDGKSRVYSNCLEIYPDVLSYWRFDVLTQNGIGYDLLDSSQYAQTAFISSNPTKTSPGVSLSNSKWDTLGTCVDLFSNSEFPKYTLNLQNYPVNGIQYRINMNNGDMLLKILNKDDKLMFSYGDCSPSNVFLQLSITQSDSGFIQVQSTAGLPNTVYGRFVEVCYSSLMIGRTVRLGQLYIPNVPEHISPSFGASDTIIPSTITFSLIGGDQSMRDLLTLVSFETDSSSASKDSVLVDESKATFATSTMTLGLVNNAPTYSSITSSALDLGSYTILWRPSYLTYKTYGDLNEYKNLFTLWSIQGVPKIQFPLVAGLVGVVNNGVLFKGQLFYVDTIGPGQSNGDQLLFCYTGCNYLNHKGPVYTRVNGNYPPIWLGEEYGVSNLLDQIMYDRIYICWRPAARAATIDPADDMWSTMYQVTSGTQIQAYLRINLITTNQYLPEIADLSPPITNPVLVTGDSISFTISKCTTSKMKPSSFGAYPGRVQVVHVNYNALDHSSYTTEIIWEQLFTQLPDNTNDGFSIGDLEGDYMTCKYTIKNLPESKLLPGHTYQLIIYSMSFKSAFNTDYLFGTLSPSIPQFVYWFTFQEAIFNVTTRNYIPTETKITLLGSNFGNVVIKGDGISETYKLFGISAQLLCGVTNIPVSYILKNIDQAINNTIVLAGLNLQDCNDSLILNVQLSKISERDDYPIWSYTGTTTNITLGKVGCDASCATCNGSTAIDCLSCIQNSQAQYLYYGQCISQCPDDLPIAQIIFEQGTTTIDYYECVSVCDEGFYLDVDLNMCLLCNEQCRTCTSGKPMSCISCQGIPLPSSTSLIDYMNTYTELYYFNGMCMTSCPVVSNELSVTRENLVVSRPDTHFCLVSALPSGSFPISVALQPPFYPEKVDIKISMQLRALINDSAHNLTSICWSGIPPENTSSSTFLTSDERIFSNYDPSNLNNSITTLNMNSFNYKGQTNQMRILLKTYTSDSLDFEVFELFGNRPPDITGNITFSPSSNFKTLSYFNLSISAIQDADDYLQLLTFKIFLQPRSLVIPSNAASLTPTPLNALQILAQLPANTITLSSSRVLRPDVNNNYSISINNIYLPVLINGPQSISGLTLNVVTCDLFVYCEDRQLGLTTIKQTINVTESYYPESRSALLMSLYNSAVNPKGSSNMTWDMALSIAQSFLITIQPSLSSYMSYSSCSRDSQCNGNGKCISSGGISQCLCNQGYTGINCNWTQSDLWYTREIGKSVLNFLNNTVLVPSYGQIIKDSNIMNQIALILTGLLQNPEVIDPDYSLIISQLCQYMTNVDYLLAGRLLDFQKNNVLNAVDNAMEYFFYNLRTQVNTLYLMSDGTGDINISLQADFAEYRRNLVNIIVPLKNGLYNFADRISIAQFPGGTAFSLKCSTFEVFISSERANDLFASPGEHFGIEPSTTFGAIKLPKSAIDSVKDQMIENGEFKIRAIKWTQDPFLFSDYHSVVCTTVMSMALLDNNGTKYNLNLTEPIIMLLPITNVSMNFPEDYIKCMYFNESNRAKVISRSVSKIDVNLLNISDQAKKRIYPQWDPIAFANTHLIVDQYSYSENISNYPDYSDSDGISSYGNIFKLTSYDGYIPCAAYHLSEIAAIVKRKRGTELSFGFRGFYNNFDSLSTWQDSLGIFICSVLTGIFCVTFLISWITDVIFVPRLEKFIEIHRQEYTEKEGEMNSMRDNSEFGDVNSNIIIKKKDVEGLEELDKKGKEMTEKQEYKKFKSDLDISRDELEKEKVHEKEKGAEETLTKKQDKADLTSSDAKSNMTIHTFHNPTTTQELSTSINMRTGVQPIPLEEDKSFSDNPAGGIRKRIQEKRMIEDIFSEEHLARREEYEFSMCNLILRGNPILNLITVTNTLFFRTSRCILLFVYFHLILLWTSILISSTISTIDHPEDTKEASTLVMDNIWISFTSPIPASIFLFLFAGLYKVQESRVQKARTIGQYKRLQ